MALGMEKLIAQQHGLYRNHNTWKTLSGTDVIGQLDQTAQQGYRIRLVLLPTQLNDSALMQRLQHCENGQSLKTQLCDMAGSGVKALQALFDGNIIRALSIGNTLVNVSLYGVYRLAIRQQENSVIIELMPTSTGRKPRFGDLLIS